MLARFPFEVLFNIFGFLPQQDVWSLLTTCKYLSPVAIKSFTTGHCKTTTQCTALASALGSGSANIRKISVNYTAWLTMQKIDKVLRHAGRIHELTVCGYDGLQRDIPGVGAALQSMHRLRYLKITVSGTMRGATPVVFEKSLPNGLEVLDFTLWSSLSYKDIRFASRNLLSLHTLILHGTAILNVPALPIKSVRHLSLHGAPRIESSLAAILFFFPCLDTLCLDDVGRLSLINIYGALEARLKRLHIGCTVICSGTATTQLQLGRLVVTGASRFHYGTNIHAQINKLSPALDSATTLGCSLDGVDKLRDVCRSMAARLSMVRWLELTCTWTEVGTPDLVVHARQGGRCRLESLVVLHLKLGPSNVQMEDEVAFDDERTALVEALPVYMPSLRHLVFSQNGAPDVVAACYRISGGVAVEVDVLEGERLLEYCARAADAFDAHAFDEIDEHFVHTGQ